MLIPKRIYQSWKTKNANQHTRELIENTKKLNPGYTYELFDDDDCRSFILKHFGENYANAFDVLIPGAFKCDFWRYCKLYIDGGIYMDLDMIPLVPFNEIIDGNDEFVSCVDVTKCLSKKCGIYQAFIASVPKHPILLYSIQITFYNIVTRRIEFNELLGITGPVAMGNGYNLFKGKKNIYDDIKSGKDNNVTLHIMDKKFVYDYKTNNKIFKNKDDDYKPITNYGWSQIYKDDPRSGFRRFVQGIFIFLIIALLIFFFLFFRYKKKLKVCESSCSYSEK
jgi:mannosyltransferase OCH1-like enzyme